MHAVWIARGTEVPTAQKKKLASGSKAWQSVDLLGLLLVCQSLPLPFAPASLFLVSGFWFLFQQEGPLFDPEGMTSA